ncbi:MAG: hypothetical protein RBR22_09135 [Desulfuromonas sp.]|nr:hypothetical protein [Desulfuromonas sp.]
MQNRCLQILPNSMNTATAKSNTDRPNLPRLFAAIAQEHDGQLPFGAYDVTAGSESELQAVVIGSASNVDLPQTIENSRFFANLIKRAHAGEMAEKHVEELRAFLSNQHRVWENSWVRLERKRLSRNAQRVLDQDLLIDKKNPRSGTRSDASRFCYLDAEDNEKVRLPISYLIKLALAEVVGCQPQLDPLLVQTANKLQNHYLNDNTSPETFSFHVVNLSPQGGQGNALARETAKRFLLTQLLVDYANHKFGLLQSGQQAQYTVPRTRHNGKSSSTR